jgi:hypothetical protein
MNRLVHRALQVYARATPRQIAQGHGWYHRAYLECVRLAAGTDLTPEQVAGALSALSPRTPYNRNLELVTELVRHGDCITIGARKQKAVDILMGAYGTDIDSITEAFDPRTAPKTRAFFRAICGDTEAITIDGHMLDVFGDGHLRKACLGYCDRYERYANAIRQVAHLTHSLPAHCQAVLWLVMTTT